ncbi:hypothetical protein [Streptomyces sp. SPB074]|uniref:hypothetical protein n=1 Tax=Streptomyces sp. (strain SPB074) TaxID=465543 RepID=UPI00017F105B|nr:hypothetical protein [Streptomyces sp. SPB074]EDY43611.1 hypothetical protein SSBG_01573 [Streptomyces sp. SPB074]
MEQERPENLTPLAEAQIVCAELAEAIRAVNLTLPSLRVDLPSAVAEYGALLDLGRVNLSTAGELVRILRRAAAEGGR